MQITDIISVLTGGAPVVLIGVGLGISKSLAPTIEAYNRLLTDGVDRQIKLDKHNSKKTIPDFTQPSQSSFGFIRPNLVAMVGIIYGLAVLAIHSYSPLANGLVVSQCCLAAATIVLSFGSIAMEVVGRMLLSAVEAILACERSSLSAILDSQLSVTKVVAKKMGLEVPDEPENEERDNSQ
ncbi:MAG: hypothetical protein U0941_25100 [Planctomycetaceae bacterium]